jgi:multiple sugar transport system permease protein
MLARPRINRHQKNKALGMLMIMPWLSGVLLFKLIPILASLAISFTDFKLLTPGQTRFTGLENYIRLFHDEGVGYAIFDTISLGLSLIPLQIAASVWLAAMLGSPRIKNGLLVRTLFFLPSIIPSVAIFFMWIGFTDPATGWLNKLILQPINGAQTGRLYQDAITGFLNNIASLWAIGPGMLIMLGALQGISPELNEAARVDGAGPLVRFFYITLPMISPAIFFALIINLIAVFGGVLLLDRGNIFSGSFSPYDGYISYILFQQHDLGYAASLSWFLLILVMGVVTALFASARRWVYYPDKDA